MKNKKKLFSILGVVLILAVTVTLLVVSTSAADPEPVLSIDFCNLSFRDSVCIKYAVSSNVENVKLLVWTEPQEEYTVGTQSAALTSVGTETIGEAEYMIFDYTGVSAKQMTDVIYARAYAVDGGETYYSQPNKYSVLQYVYNKNGKLGTTADENLKNLLDSMLKYGADAQTYFGYQADRLATADFYQVAVDGGALSDGFDHGLYLAGEVVNLTAPAADKDGGSFSHWKDSKGNKVADSASFDLTVPGKNETYTPVYVKYSSGLEIDEEGYVLSLGDCTDSDVVIPPKTADGIDVIAIDASAFAGEPITSISIPATVVEIGRRAFNGCSALTDVYYDGTEAEWEEKVSISSGNDALLNATFHFNAEPVETFTVTFVDHDGTVLKTCENVESGTAAAAPSDPTREGYTFIGWDKEFDNVTSDLTITAQYEKVQISYTEPTLVVDSVSAKAGDTVQVAVSLHENPGVLGAVLKLSWEEGLTLTAIENGSAFSALSLTGSKLPRTGNANFNWYATEISDDQVKDGEVLMLTFTVSDTVAAGTNIALEASYVEGDFFDRDKNPVELNIVNGSVTVTK